MWIGTHLALFPQLPHNALWIVYEKIQLDSQISLSEIVNIIRNGLLDCPSITSFSLKVTDLTSAGLDLLRPAFYNTSITSLYIPTSRVGGQRGSEAICDLVVGNNTLVKLDLKFTSIGRVQFATGLHFPLDVS
jgi:hypothetical protein